MKKFFLLIICVLSLTLLSACGGESKPDASDTQEQQEPAEQAEPLDLTGEWKTKGAGEETGMGIYIEGKTIEVYWLVPEEDAVMLYWAGTYNAPIDAEEPYTWTSDADAERNSAAILSSTDETKEFTYENGTLSCSVTAFDQTKNMEFERGEWGYAEQSEEAAKQEGTGTLGDFDVTIKGAALAKDYEGNPAIVVTYSWTNNSDETTSAMSAVMEKAFQDGVSLETAIISDDDIYDSESSWKDVRPGTTIDVQKAFVMTSETSTVEFEISEFLSFESNPPIVTMNFEPEALS